MCTGLSASDYTPILVSALMENREKASDCDGQAIMVDLFSPFPKDYPSNAPVGEDSQHLE